uniref:Uncharacterized protein n=2 Tax=Anguilla anguilla TaxID=7936 RepID=A0A0E9UUE4_ANGAN
MCNLQLRFWLGSASNTMSNQICNPNTCHYTYGREINRIFIVQQNMTGH